MSTYNIQNIDILKDIAKNISKVFLSDGRNDFDIKFFNIENLTDRVWRERYGAKESPIIELISTEKYNKTFFSLNMKVKIENIEIKKIEDNSGKNQKSNISEKIFDIYCDGSCTNNPGGEIGSGVAVYENSKLIYSFAGDYSSIGTNNQAELNAFIFALKSAKDLQDSKKITIYADSQYVINSVTNWAFSWEKNNWKKKGGIKNLELIKDAFYLYRDMKDFISVKYVKAHSGIEGNERADQLASIAVKNRITKWSSI